MSGWFEDELDDRRRRGLYRIRRRLESGQRAHVRIGGRDVLNFSSNDYLGLASDPRLARAASAAARRWGVGAGASPLVSGHLPSLRALEHDLARWEATEAALVFSSGFAANLGTVAALAGPGDAIFSDALNHASLIDGCRLSRAAVHVYRHRNFAHLHELIHTFGPAARHRLIVSDSLFSMDGDSVRVGELLDIAERADALLVLDEAHATGIYGRCGRGIADDLPSLAPRHRLVKVGTLSKALGSQGGFVCGPRSLINWLINHARPYIFSTALAPPAAAAARAALRIVQSEPERRLHVQELAAHLNRRLSGCGYDIGLAETHILPVLIRTSQIAVRLSRKLLEEGLLVPAIRPPSVPEGTARLRVSLTASHTTADVERLVAALLRYFPQPLR
jgi:8-amino-7-oxononanoate synthase